MWAWIVRRWQKTGRPVLCTLDPPRGFFLSEKPLKAGERYFRHDPFERRIIRLVVAFTAFVPFFVVSYYWCPNYRLGQWAKYIAHEELMRDDEEWAEIGKEYGFDKLPRNRWKNDLGVAPVMAGIDHPWPGLEFPTDPKAAEVPPMLIGRQYN